MDRASGTGWPKVEVFVCGRFYKVVTDAKGRYDLPYYWQTRSIAVRFLAPSRMIRKRVITTKEITINRGDVVTVDVIANASLFADPPLDTLDGVFRGVFSSGFEHSSFEPDDGSVILPGGRQKHIQKAWVEFVGMNEALAFKWDKTYRVTWSGRLTGPGSYGHMGASEYLMEVERVEESREDDDESRSRGPR